MNKQMENLNSKKKKDTIKGRINGCLELKNIISEIKISQNSLNMHIGHCRRKTDTLGHNLVDRESVPK